MNCSVRRMAMSKKVFISILIILTIVNLSATVTILYERWSHKSPMHPMEDFDSRFGDRIRDRLDLTPEQIDRIRESMREHWQKIGPIMNEYDSLRGVLFDEVSQDSPSVERIDQLLSEMGGLQTNMQRESIYHIIQEREFLTPEQRERLEQMFINRIEGEFRHPMFQGFMDRGPQSDRHKRPFKDDSIRMRKHRNNPKQNNGGSL
jgi:Spy/CpxP family protein refolding chaperone